MPDNDKVKKDNLSEEEIFDEDEMSFVKEFGISHKDILSKSKDNKEKFNW